MILSVPHFTETIILVKKQTNITAIVIMSGSTNEFDQSNPLDKQLKQHPFTTSKTRYGKICAQKLATQMSDRTTLSL